MNRKIILASASPRRKELLSRFIKNFCVEAADVDETPEPAASAEEAAISAAEKKAYKISSNAPSDALIIAADTIVCLNGKIYGKPSSAEDARKTLRELNGKTHTVITAVLCKDNLSGKIIRFTESAKVFFVPYGDDIISKYIATGEPFGKAGSYAIQGMGCMLAEKTEGDYDSIVGLPIGRLIRELEAIDIFLF